MPGTRPASVRNFLRARPLLQDRLSGGQGAGVGGVHDALQQHRASSQGEDQPPPESQQSCSPRSMRGLEASSFYCLHGHWYHGIFCNRCDIGIQNAVLRAAREAEPKALHVVLAMGTNDGSDLEHTTSASWYKPDHMLIHGFEIGHGAWAKAIRKFTSTVQR